MTGVGRGANRPRRRVRAWLKRLWPLVLLGAGALVFAMGWHRYLTLQELAENRQTLRGLMDANIRC